MAVPTASYFDEEFFLRVGFCAGVDEEDSFLVYCSAEDLCYILRSNFVIFIHEYSLSLKVDTSHVEILCKCFSNLHIALESVCLFGFPFKVVLL